MDSKNQLLGLKHMDKAGRKKIHHCLVIDKKIVGYGQI